MKNKLEELFKTLVESMGLQREMCSVAENLSTYSATYTGALFCRVKLTGKVKYISFPVKYYDIFSDSFATNQINSEPDFFRIQIEDVSDIEIMSPQISEVIKRITPPTTFDICSRYMECSDLKTCVHPDKVFSLECRYREKLKKGIIFYGKNRNV